MSSVKLKADSNGGTIAFKGSSSSSNNVELTLPSTIGSNDQVLKLSGVSGQTGDLTWGASAPEGTAVKSTGESGGTKFLREDGDGTCSWQTASGTDTLSFRNVLINSEMKINQRGNVTGITSSKYAGPDRWKANLNAGTWTVSGESDAPAGFSNSYKILCTTANNSLSAGSIVQVYQALEGQDVQRFKKGTSGALQFAVSFWVKANLTGTYIVELHDNDNSRCVSGSYTISSSATWEKKTITFPADTTGAFGNDNGDSFKIYFKLAAGTNFTSGTLQTSAWIAQDNTKRAAGQVNLAATVNNYWQVTAVQVEAGATSSEFEYRSYQDELRRCKRYCTIYAGNSAGEPSGLHGYLESTSYVIYPIIFDPPLRAGPSFDQNSASVKHYSYDNSGSDSSGLSVPLYNANPVDNSCTAANLKFTISGLGSAGTTGQLYFMGAGKFFFTSEL